MKSLVCPSSAAGVPENHRTATDRPRTDHHTRKAELRALVLQVQASAQALEAGHVEPLQSIGGAA